MDALSCGATTSATKPPLLYTVEPLRRTIFNRIFAVIYLFALLALFCHHVGTLHHTKTIQSFSVSAAFFIADLVLAFMWANGQAFRMSPVRRREFTENIEKIMKQDSVNLPALDVFICTADPYKEPPMSVVNTALSVMAYDYPAEKVSVYVSDDGGSALTLFAFMEAAKFASHWLPFCGKMKMIERSPEAYFGSNYSRNSETETTKAIYESMKIRVEKAVEMGKVGEEFLKDQEREFFSRWATEFTRQDHPAIIQVLLQNERDTDVKGQGLPNLIYLSREKSKTSPHHFKAGAQNALLRVSAAMTNSPIILTLDCDMYSTNPQAPLHALCYMLEPSLQTGLAFVQFPQRYHGLNQPDMYASEHKRLFLINSQGLDGLLGPNHVGTNCFFARRALFSAPPSTSQIPQSSLHHHVVNKPINSPSVLELAHHVAGCRYEEQTKWGSEIGFRYGSLVEDYYTGYRLHCEGWKSVFCNPEKASFMGDVPVSLVDVLSQAKRWSVGLLEVGFSKYSPITFGVKSMGLFMGLGYSFYAFWPLFAIPIVIYSFLPQLALLHGVSVFPKVWEPLFFIYIFLVLGAYGQDMLEFLVTGGTIQRWISDQRMWMLKGTSCYLFGLFEFLAKSAGIQAPGFNLTSKVADDEQSRRYERGIYEFGVESPMFLVLSAAAIINLCSVVWGLREVFSGGEGLNGKYLQILLAGCVVINSMPIYEAMMWRSDRGRMPTRCSVAGGVVALALYAAAAFVIAK